MYWMKNYIWKWGDVILYFDWYEFYEVVNLIKFKDLYEYLCFILNEYLFCWILLEFWEGF